MTALDMPGAAASAVLDHLVARGGEVSLTEILATGYLPASPPIRIGASAPRPPAETERLLAAQSVVDDLIAAGLVDRIVEPGGIRIAITAYGRAAMAGRSR